MIYLEQEEVVAFTAANEARQSYSPGEQIQYSTVITNVGGGYVPGQSEFICPISGTYVFSITSTAHRDDMAMLELWMDAARVVITFSTSSLDAQANALVTLQCSSGSKVFVRCHQSFPCVPYGAQYGISDTFSGYLLSSDD